MGTKWDSLFRVKMGINLQLVGAIYPCSGGWERDLSLFPALVMPAPRAARTPFIKRIARSDRCPLDAIDPIHAPRSTSASTN